MIAKEKTAENKKQLDEIIKLLIQQINSLNVFKYVLEKEIPNRIKCAKILLRKREEVGKAGRAIQLQYKSDS